MSLIISPSVSSVSGNGTVSGISLSGNVTFSGSLTLGGTLDLSSPPIIGGVSPNTGKFTSLTIPTNTTDATFIKDDNLTAWVYSGKSISVTAQETAPSGIYFSPDGLRMYVIGSTGDDVNQYSLSTAWDVTTASFVRVSAVLSETAPTGVFFKPDGTQMYVVGSTNDTVQQYGLSTAWDVSTLSVGVSLSVTAQDTVPQDIWFRSDGLKMYMVGSTNDRVYEYNLGTAWVVNTATFVQFFSVATQELTPVSIDFASDGTRMYVLGATGLDISRYTLSTPWNISTAVYYNNFYIGFQETAPSGMFIDRSNGVAYVVGSTADTVFQYSTETDGIELQSVSGLFINGSLYTNKNLVVTANSRIDGALSVSGAITGASFTGAVAATTISASSTLTLGSATTSANVIGTTVTTGSTTIGGTSQTGLLVFGQSTATSTTEIAKGATISGSTKTVNIGTGGVSGSITNVNIGSSVSGATSTTSIGGTLTVTGTTATAGHFDAGTTTPTGTTRLNYGGYFYPTFINLAGSGDTATAATHYMVETGSDGFVRPKTLANVRTEVVTSAAINSAIVTATTTSTSGAFAAPFLLNANTISANYTIPVGYNAVAAGPVTVANGIVVTVSDGSTWVIV